MKLKKQSPKRKELNMDTQETVRDLIKFIAERDLNASQAVAVLEIAKYAILVNSSDVDNDN